MTKDEKKMYWAQFFMGALSSPLAEEHPCCVGCWALNVADGGLMSMARAEQEGFFDDGVVEEKARNAAAKQKEEDVKLS